MIHDSRISLVLPWVLKGHSRLAHVRIGCHFIAHLHITETQSIWFLTKYDKNNIIG